MDQICFNQFPNLFTNRDLSKVYSQLKRVKLISVVDLRYHLFSFLLIYQLESVQIVDIKVTRKLYI